MHRPDPSAAPIPVTEPAAAALNPAPSQGGEAGRRLAATTGGLTQRGCR